ncbi:MAG: ATP-binding protein [Bdellovibrionota bacterium]|nr:ATP-binding protein [Bdellovibrionota bacterium]
MEKLLVGIFIVYSAFNLLSLQMKSLHDVSLYISLSVFFLSFFCGVFEVFIKNESMDGANLEGTEVQKSHVDSLEEDLANMKEQIEQLARLSSLGEVAGNMGHEINNQLAVIEGWADQLSRAESNPKRANPEFVAKAGGKILTHIQRLHHLTAAIRNFVRKNNEAEYGFHDIRDIIKDAVDIASPKAKKNHVAVKSFFEGGDFSVRCMGVEISQVILNLLSNAVDAVGDQEKPWIQVRVIEKPEQFEISVTDSGDGIDPAIVQKMMSPYFTTKAPGKGTGIGLSISKNIIKSHSGRLEYDSDFKFTRFLIYLPKELSQKNVEDDSVSA